MKYLALGIIVLMGCPAIPEPPIITEKTTREIATTTCVNHTGIGFHIHSQLRITINDEPQIIPANIGIELRCLRPLHTHDDSGRIHVEALEKRDFTLGDFFAVWKKDFSSIQILDKVVDAQHRIRMTVNGQPNTQFENYVLQNDTNIEIRYESK